MNGESGLLTRQLDIENECVTVRKGGRRQTTSLTPKQIRAMVESQGYTCALSGVPLTPAIAVLDHIIPLSRGGLHTIDNAQVIADYINKAKGTMTQDEFIAMCVAVARHNGH